MRPVRVAVAGSVDDGKSTLLGRLLNDTERVFVDEVEAVRRASGEELNLAFFTDGLVAERARGITMDVAWRHLTLEGRRLLLADVPGHAELVRNMATGASVADAAVLLVDAARGVQAQTRRHLTMLSGLGVEEVLVCLNKMDEVGFSADVASELRAAIARLQAPLGLRLEFIPVCALSGDNVARRSARMGWYEGPTLVDWLASLRPPEVPARFDALVQLDSDAQGWTSLHPLSGGLPVGPELYSAPGAGTVRVVERSPLGAGRVRLSAPQPRGTLLSSAPIPVGRRWDVVVTWLGPGALRSGSALRLLQHGRVTRAEVGALLHRSRESGLLEDAAALDGGDVGEVTLELERPTWLVHPALLVDGDGQTVGGVRPR
ncbi:MAG: 50S ribosome-binding GTPase [Myxococcales bacterium]|nr:50S ribosome-binding GTPase [Myxococcales bacterium]